MLTLPTGSTELLDRPAYRPYSARVSRLQQLSPHFIRVTFTGDDFAEFGTAGLDQRLKIVLPITGFGIAELGTDGATWYENWRALPDERRNPFRTYTVRAIRPAQRELDVDFVVHERDSAADLGPAARWLAAATLGSEVVIVGPDARSPMSDIGLDWHPGDATELLICGDETAAPAIAGILATLDDSVTVSAFIEVPVAADALDLEVPVGSRVTWLARGDAELGSRLEPAVREWAANSAASFRSAVATEAQPIAEIDVDRDLLWDSPEETTGAFYAWIAGESAVVKRLRRFLVTETGIDRRRVAFMGYWRHGRAEAQ